jgi:hypothetical protein
LLEWGQQDRGQKGDAGGEGGECDISSGESGGACQAAEVKERGTNEQRVGINADEEGVGSRKKRGLESPAAVNTDVVVDRLSVDMVGMVTSSGRNKDDGLYLELLRHSKVVVTANPSSWEGDHRLWEVRECGSDF